MSELTYLLQKSLQFDDMRKALIATIPLLRGEQQSFAEVLYANKGRSSFALDTIQEQHDHWLKVINQCEAALKPAPVSKPDVIPQLQCPICTKGTPGTIDGVCIGCYEALNGLEAVEPGRMPTVVEMPRRTR